MSGDGFLGVAFLLHTILFLMLEVGACLVSVSVPPIYSRFHVGGLCTPRISAVASQKQAAVMIYADDWHLQCTYDVKIPQQGGCLCAGPYGHSLLGISDEAATVLEELLLNKNEIVRPGFVRVSLNYYWSAEKVNFVSDALNFVRK